MAFEQLPQAIIDAEKIQEKPKGTESHSIIAIVGNPGTGKSLLLTGLLCWELEHKRTVFSTYHITYPTPLKQALAVEGVKNTYELTGHYRTNFVDFGKLLTLLMGKRKSYPLGTAVLGLDEVTVGLDSRESKSTANIYLTKCMMQARKLGLDIYFVAQLFSRVDKSLRNMTGLIIVCEKGLVPWYKDPRQLVPIFTYHFCDPWANDGAGTVLGTFAIDYDRFLEISRYYDTQERVEETAVQLGKENSRDMIDAITEVFEDSEEARMMPGGTNGKAKEAPATISKD